jgi:hypothetical protein
MRPYFSLGLWTLLVAVAACAPNTAVTGASVVCAYVVSTGDGVIEASAQDAGACPTAGLADGAPPTITVGDTGAQLVVTVTAPQGPWQAMVTATGAISLIDNSGDASATESLSQAFQSDGVSTQLVFPIVPVAPGGNASVQITVGTTVQTLSFVVAPEAVTASPTCIALASGTQARVVAWSDIPPPPPVVSFTDCGAVVEEAGSSVDAVVVDIGAYLVDCSTPEALDGGDASPVYPALAGGTVVLIAGTGGLEPTAATATTNADGTVYFELRGPAVVTQASAILTTAGGAELLVQVPEPDGDH